MYSEIRRRWMIVCLILFAAVALGCSATVSLEPGAIAQPTLIVNRLSAIFLGQDGGGYAGRLCSTGTAADNVHIHLTGLRTEVEAVAFRVDDYAAGGVWATPCDPISNWQLHVLSPSAAAVDLYFKPFRDAPTGTEYIVTIKYSDGQTQKVTVTGARVRP
jgi:hypothetical protein